MEKNEGKRLSAIVSFGKKVTEDTPDVVKALIELRKEDPSLFDAKRPNTTMINDTLISGISRKGLKDSDEAAESALRRVNAIYAARKAEADAIAAAKKKEKRKKNRKKN